MSVLLLRKMICVHITNSKYRNILQIAYKHNEQIESLCSLMVQDSIIRLLEGNANRPLRIYLMHSYSILVVAVHQEAYERLHSKNIIHMS